MAFIIIFDYVFQDMMFVKIMSFLVMFLKMSFTRNQSERVRNEAVRLMREREDKTTMTQVPIMSDC